MVRCEYIPLTLETLRKYRLCEKESYDAVAGLQLLLSEVKITGLKRRTKRISLSRLESERAQSGA